MVTDVLVIGTGIAGLSYAIEMAESLPDSVITIVSKSNLDDNATKRAQGGIAVVTGQNTSDDYLSHVEDTCRVGGYQSDREVVEMVVQKAYSGFSQLENWGCTFDRDNTSKYDLSLEAGHSNKRIVHIKDYTGAHIIDHLIEKAQSLINIFFIKDFFIKDLLVTDGPEKICYGATYINCDGEEFPLFSRITMLASGGVGQIYKYTTNPLCATGDGIAMAIRAGAAVEDIEFVQFHPTAFYHEQSDSLPLITEALRGEGAIIVDQDGIDFTKKYHPDGSLAPRDVVSRAIISEMSLTNQKCMFLDVTKVDQHTLKNKFPSVWKRCEENGIQSGFIPIVPAAHYLCGGIKTDLYGRTSIDNLFASGECSRTGLHGANRLASNSLIESVVFAHQAVASSLKQLKRKIYLPQLTHFKSKLDQTSTEIDLQQIFHFRERIKEIMHHFFGVYKSTSGMQQGYSELKTIYNELLQSPTQKTEAIEVLNMGTCAMAIAEASLSRSENIGTFYNKDLE